MDWGEEVKPRSEHSGRGGIDNILKDARRGNLDAVKAHLRADPSLLQAKSGGHNRTFLWEATRGNRIELVKYLLRMKADPNIPGRIRSEIPVLLKPYCIARRYKRGDIARRLMKAGTVIDIYSAAYLGDIAEVERMLNDNPRLLTEEQADDTVWRVTVLHYAVVGGHVEMTQSLIRRGAKVRPYTRLLCDVADQKKRPELIAALEKGGADRELVRIWS